MWGTAVLVPAGPDGAHQVVQLGGSDLPANNPTAVASAEVFDTATDQWTVHNQGDTFALNEPRSHANTVLLPDGSMVEVGGGLGSATPADPGTNGAPGQWAAEDAQKQIELWDPATKKWTPRAGAARVPHLSLDGRPAPRRARGVRRRRLQREHRDAERLHA